MWTDNFRSQYLINCALSCWFRVAFLDFSSSLLSYVIDTLTRNHQTRFTSDQKYFSTFSRQKWSIRWNAEMQLWFQFLHWHYVDDYFFYYLPPFSAYLPTPSRHKLNGENNILPFQSIVRNHEQRRFISCRYYLSIYWPAGHVAWHYVDDYFVLLCCLLFSKQNSVDLIIILPSVIIRLSAYAISP